MPLAAVAALTTTTIVEVYPKKGETYPDAAGVPITAVGARVLESKYIEDALRDGFLLTWDPLEINEPDDRTNLAGDAPDNATYIVASANAVLKNELVLTQGANITLTPGAGTMTISSAGSPNAVIGPASSTNNAVMLFGDTTGKLAKNSNVTINTAGDITTPGLVDGVDVSALSAAVANKVTGPTSAVDDRLARYDGTSGKLIDASSVAVDDGGNMSGVGHLTIAGNLNGVKPSNWVVGPASSTDNALARFDLATGKLVQSSGVTLDDGNNISGVGAISTVNLTATGNITVSGTVDGVDVGNLAAVPFVTIGNTATLPNERALTQGSGITITDGGPGGAVTISAAAGGGAPTTPSYLTLAADASLPNERVLTPGAGVLFSDGGAGNALTVTQSGTLIGVESFTGNATLDVSHIGKLIRTYGAGTITITLPPSPPDHASFWFYKDGNASSNLAINGNGLYFYCPGLEGVPTVQVDNLYGVVFVCRNGPGGSWTATGNVRGMTSPGAPVGASYLTLSADGTLTNERVLTQGPGIAITDGGAGGALTVAGNVPWLELTGAAHTISAAHYGKVIYTQSANPVYTVPSLTGAGHELYIFQHGTTQVTLQASGTTLLAPPDRALRTRAQNSFVRLRHAVDQYWAVDGDLDSSAAAGGGYYETASTDYTLQLSDAGKIIGFTSAASFVRVPPNVFPVGTKVWVVQASTVTTSELQIEEIGEASGVTFHTPARRTRQTGGGWALVCLEQTELNEWTLSGGLDDQTGYFTFGTSDNPYAWSLEPGAGLAFREEPGQAIFIDATGGGGAGDVTGPASSVDNAVTRFDLTTGKVVQGSLVTIDDSGNIATPGTVDGVDVSALNTTVTNKVTGPASAVDNAVPRFDLTTGKVIQSSGLTIDDTNSLSGIYHLSMTGNLTLGAGGTVDGHDINVSMAARVTGPASSVDNTIPRYDQTTGKVLQTSGVVIDDTNNITGVAGLTCTGANINGSISGVASFTCTSATVNGNITVTGTVDGVDVSTLNTTVTNQQTSINNLTNRPYITFGADAVLSAERSLVTGDSITLVDEGSAARVHFRPQSILVQSGPLTLTPSAHPNGCLINCWWPAADVAFTLAADSSYNFPNGTILRIARVGGTPRASLAAAGGVDLFVNSAATSWSGYLYLYHVNFVTLHKVYNNTWFAQGICSQ